MFHLLVICNAICWNIDQLNCHVTRTAGWDMVGLTPEAVADAFFMYTCVDRVDSAASGAVIRIGNGDHISAEFCPMTFIPAAIATERLTVPNQSPVVVHGGGSEALKFRKSCA